MVRDLEALSIPRLKAQLAAEAESVVADYANLAQGFYTEVARGLYD